MLESERVVVQAPMSFVGSARRIWRMTQREDQWQVPATVLALVVIPLAWSVIVAWYLVFGIFVIPWRLLRRGQRQRKQDALRQREVLNAVMTHGLRPSGAPVPPPPMLSAPLPPPVAQQRAEDDPPGYF